LVGANKTALDLPGSPPHVLFSYFHLLRFVAVFIRKFRITIVIFEWSNSGPCNMWIGRGLLLTNTEVLVFWGFPLRRLLWPHNISMDW
jgi:hypothetical protein